ncbi:hypothetical protein OWS73_33475 [Burkholderia sp. 1B3(2022)]|uniref:AbiTii domain-containing protein n=1 Tax=Burkholderia sp. 1B3(2022) TaxID=2997425 RepID=UPI002FCA40F0
MRRDAFVILQPRIAVRVDYRKTSNSFMAKSIVLELQDLASDGDHDINDLLRKTLMVATKLEVKEFRAWATAELHGYTGEARKTLPPYRLIRGEMSLYHPTLGPVAFRALPQQLYNELVLINVTESVASLIHLLDRERTDSVVYDFSPEQERILRSLPVESLKRFRATRTVAKNRIMALLDAVRTTILEWALTLEKDGIMGEGLSFSEKEKRAVMQTFNINNFQGVLGNVEAGASVTQTNTQQVMAADFASLAQHLAGRGVSQGDLDELQCAVQEDPKPRSIEHLGPKVSAWVSNMVMKAASGTWNIGIAAAGGFLAEALGKYYGII